MEFKFEFQLQPNLRRMAFQAVALSLWERDDIRSKLKQWLCYHNYWKVYDKFEDLIKEVIGEIDRNNLPSSLYYELVLLVKSYGYTLRSWFKCLKRNKVFRSYSSIQIYEKLFSTVYWTHYGTIDEEKIFRYWLANDHIDEEKAYFMACRYCLVDVIQDLWRKISQKKIVTENEDLSRKIGFHLVYFWNKFMENDLETFEKQIIIRDEDYRSSIGRHDMFYSEVKSVNYNMARMSVLKGYALAFKYFWNEMIPEERYQGAIDFMGIIIQCFTNSAIHKRKYRPRKRTYIEIYCLLLDFLSKNEEKVLNNLKTDEMGETKGWNYFIEYFALMVIGRYPWQEFFPVTFEVHLDDDNGSEIFKKLFAKLYNDYMNFNIPACHNKLQMLLRKLWHSTPGVLRGKVMRGQQVERLLLDTKDLSIIKLILGDEYLSYDIKSEILKRNYSNIFSSAEKEDAFLDLFNEIIISRELEVHVRDRLKFTYKSILGLKMAEKKWNAYSEIDIDVKKEINADFICLYLIYNEKYEAADVFLKWKFNDPGDIQKFKQEFLPKNEIVTRINEFWDDATEGNTEARKTRSQNFLLWVFESEKKVQSFKLEHLLKLRTMQRFPISNPYFAVQYCVINDKYFEIFDDYLSWCVLDLDNIKKTKKSLLEKDNGLECTLQKFITECDIDMAEKLLNWAFDSKEERKTFMTKFVCDTYFKNACERYIEKVTYNTNCTTEIVKEFQRFINFFVKPHVQKDNFNEVKNIFGGKTIYLESCETSDSSDNYSDYKYRRAYADEKDSYAYCIVENYKLYLVLIDSLKPKRQRKKLHSFKPKRQKRTK